VQRNKERVEAMDVKTRKAVDPSLDWNQHGAGINEINKNLEQWTNPDTVRPSAPSATQHASTSAAVYADVAGGAAHQDNGQAPAAPQTVFSTVDPTGQTTKQASYDSIAEAIAASQGMGMSGGMWMPGQSGGSSSDRPAPILTGAPGQNFSTMVASMNADAAKDAANAANLRAANALTEAASRIEKTVEKGMDGQRDALRRGMEAQGKTAEKMQQSLRDLPRKKD
jgi:hypothetical protein